MHESKPPLIPKDFHAGLCRMPASHDLSLFRVVEGLCGLVYSCRRLPRRVVAVVGAQANAEIDDPPGGPGLSEASLAEKRGEHLMAGWQFSVVLRPGLVSPVKGDRGGSRVRRLDAGLVQEHRERVLFSLVLL